MTVPGTDRPADDWLDRICGTTEMGRLVRNHDWAATPLGHPSGWSEGLRAAVGICMTSRFPLLVVWGPEHVKIYNDGYRQMLGHDKHPAALGARAADVWTEIWADIEPLFDGVKAEGRPTWAENHRFLIERNGFLEECYFTFSYSPLFDDDGSVGGILDISVETTEQVVAERRLRCLADLTAELVTAEYVTDVFRVAASVLSRWRSDVPAVDLYLRTDDDLALISSNRRRRRPPLDPSLVAGVSAAGQALVVGESDDGRGPADRYVVPIGGGFDSAEGVAVLDLDHHRAFDEQYRSFAELVAQVLSTALDSAYRRWVQVGDQRRFSDALRTAMLQPAADLPTVAARYLPADDSLALGGDWYDIIDLGEEKRAIVVGDCVGHGLDAATAMAQLRSASRAMLLDGYGPAAALTALDSFAATLDGARCATAFCAVIDRSTNTITYSRAGHPPALVVTPEGEATWLAGGTGVPLGLELGHVRVDHTAALAPEGTLVVYTDGLIERPGECLDVGFERLATAAVDLCRRPTVQSIADELLLRLLPDHVRDDVVLVVKHLPQQEAAPAEPATATPGRLDR